MVEETERPKIVPIKDLTSEPPVEKQRAIVKPHILTHVIEGFVIQEGPEPFPVSRDKSLYNFNSLHALVNFVIGKGFL